MNILKDIIFFLTHPDYWIMNHPYNKEWDKKLKTLMKQHLFTNIDGATADIDGIKLWIANYPYASFTIYEAIGTNFRVRPSRRTIRAAYSHLIHSHLSKFQKPLKLVKKKK